MPDKKKDSSKEEKDNVVYRFLPTTVAKNSSVEEIDRVESGDNLERVLPTSILPITGQCRKYRVLVVSIELRSVSGKINIVFRVSRFNDAAYLCPNYLCRKIYSSRDMQPKNFSSFQAPVRTNRKRLRNIAKTHVWHSFYPHNLLCRPLDWAAQTAFSHGSTSDALSGRVFVEEIDRVESGDNLERVLPVELSMPEDLFFKRYATKELQQFSSPGTLDWAAQTAFSHGSTSDALSGRVLPYKHSPNHWVNKMLKDVSEQIKTIEIKLNNVVMLIKWLTIPTLASSFIASICIARNCSSKAVKNEIRSSFSTSSPSLSAIERDCRYDWAWQGFIERRKG